MLCKAVKEILVLHFPLDVWDICNEIASERKPGTLPGTVLLITILKGAHGVRMALSCHRPMRNADGFPWLAEDFRAGSALALRFSLEHWSI